jgi:putative transposase
MAWKESSVMSERVGLLNDYLSGEFGIRELADNYSVSRKTVYKWIQRHESGGWRALEDLSRAPRHHPNAVASEIEQGILELKARKPRWGAPKLRARLLEKFGAERCPAESTFSQILKRHGLSRRQGRARRATPSEQPLAHAQESNRVWCADFKGWFKTLDGRKCLPLTISDAHSRYLLCCQGLCEESGFVTVQPLFARVFEEFGLPEAMRTDNGTPFAGTGLAGLTPLSVWWLRLGIELERIWPGHPEQNGRHERMHRTLQEEVDRSEQPNLRAQQQVFDGFLHEYNHERPHEALGQKTPASIYQGSVRPYPRILPEPREYPDEWEKRNVVASGQAKWKGKYLYLTKALRGQRVGFEPTADGIWAVHFQGLKLGIFDERRGKVESVRQLETTAQKNQASPKNE